MWEGNDPSRETQRTLTKVKAGKPNTITCSLQQGLLCTNLTPCRCQVEESGIYHVARPAVSASHVFIKQPVNPAPLPAPLYRWGDLATENHPLTQSHKSEDENLEGDGSHPEPVLPPLPYLLRISAEGGGEGHGETERSRLGMSAHLRGQSGNGICFRNNLRFLYFPTCSREWALL